MRGQGGGRGTKAKGSVHELTLTKTIPRRYFLWYWSKAAKAFRVVKKDQKVDKQFKSTDWANLVKWVEDGKGMSF